MLNIGSMCTGARVVAVSTLWGPSYCWESGAALHSLVGRAFHWGKAACGHPPSLRGSTYTTHPPSPGLPTLHPQVKHDLAKLQLTSPVCTKEGEKIALSRRVDKHWRLIGWGQIQKGLRLEL